jgi:hypothetical protein
MSQQYQYILNNRYLDIFDDIIYDVIYPYFKDQTDCVDSHDIDKNLFIDFFKNNLKDEYKIKDIDTLYDINEPCIMVCAESYKKDNQDIPYHITIYSVNTHDYCMISIQDKDDYTVECERSMSDFNTIEISNVINLYKATNNGTFGISQGNHSYPIKCDFYGPFSIEFKDKLFFLKDKDE